MNKTLLALSASVAVALGSCQSKDADKTASAPTASAATAPVIAPEISEPPVIWNVPEAFDTSKDGFGLEQFPGTELSFIYEPIISHADPAEGGDGKYESVMHGTYNHHQQFALIDDYVVVFWTNHVRDENGPGQRILARLGKFNEDGSQIDWGRPEDIVEVAQPVQAARLRPAADTDSVITGIFMDDIVTQVGDQILVKCRFMLCDGWTNNMKYHGSPPNTAPVPDEFYSQPRIPEKNYRYDIYWYLGSFVRTWTVKDGKLVASSEPYIYDHLPPKELQVTPTILKTMGPINELYANAKFLKDAPESFHAILRGEPKVFNRSPKYAPGTNKLAADGKNGLAHYTEFIRPDGKYVVMRDNLVDPTNYYASIKNNADECYPPAVRTNFFGAAMPVSGELPDGTVWFVGSDTKRENAYITWSKDGIHFDKTKLLIHLKFKGVPGLNAPTGGGAQYFQALTRGNYIWIVFSVSKQNIGLLKVPFSSFD
ncbi:MAG: hypothetical protein MJ106_01855 [Lentisphaeria bacterium]|nr:hypothetical protein [Lentisphaeria bacterium]